MATKVPTAQYEEIKQKLGSSALSDSTEDSKPVNVCFDTKTKNNPRKYNLTQTLTDVLINPQPFQVFWLLEIGLISESEASDLLQCQTIGSFWQLYDSVRQSAEQEITERRHSNNGGLN